MQTHACSHTHDSVRELGKRRGSRERDRKKETATANSRVGAWGEESGKEEKGAQRERVGEDWLHHLDSLKRQAVRNILVERVVEGCGRLFRIEPLCMQGTIVPQHLILPHATRLHRSW